MLWASWRAFEAQSCFCSLSSNSLLRDLICCLYFAWVADSSLVRVVDSEGSVQERSLFQRVLALVTRVDSFFAGLVGGGAGCFDDLLNFDGFEDLEAGEFFENLADLAGLDEDLLSLGRFDMRLDGCEEGDPRYGGKLVCGVWWCLDVWWM